jgi:hypothetical protein
MLRNRKKKVRRLLEVYNSTSVRSRENGNEFDGKWIGQNCSVQHCGAVFCGNCEEYSLLDTMLPRNYKKTVHRW